MTSTHHKQNLLNRSKYFFVMISIPVIHFLAETQNFKLQWPFASITGPFHPTQKSPKTWLRSPLHMKNFQIITHALLTRNVTNRQNDGKGCQFIICINSKICVTSIITLRLTLFLQHFKLGKLWSWRIIGYKLTKLQCISKLNNL